MKRNNKKGFTIVELVIVIAVIGILAAVLIPTFSGVIADANATAAKQEARNGYLECYAEDIKDGKVDNIPAATDTNYKKVTIDTKEVIVYETDGYAFDGQNFYTVSGNTYTKVTE
nr:type II secretion system protein [Oscillospiraceae bacterium]